MFRALKRSEEAVMVMYSVACKKQPDERISYLKKCANACGDDASLSAFAKAVNEYIDLLERQIAIEVISFFFFFFK